MKISEFFKTESGIIVGIGVGGILIGFGADVGIATFFVTGTVVLASAVLLALFKFYS